MVNSTPAALESGRDDKYRLPRALRPFSLVVALVASGLGVALAYADGYPLGVEVPIVLAAALLLQAGVNLINDRADLDDPRLARRLPAASRRAIRRHYRLGLASLGLALLLGARLLDQGGGALLALVLLGALGAWGYTQEPINYKRRGLGVALVFWLMGALLVGGVYLAVSGVWSWSVLGLAAPVSLLVSLLLLSNEIRDLEADRADGVGTLSVRLGARRARRLYRLLLAGAFAGAALLSLVGLMPGFYWLAGLLPVPGILARLGGDAELRRRLPPLTGRVLALFGAGQILGLVL